MHKHKVLSGFCIPDKHTQKIVQRCTAHHVENAKTLKAMYSIPYRNERVYGGCLGFKKRWRTWYGCDKLGGDAKQSIYPEISEWGNSPAYGRYSCMRERTQGSKTFQYLEEKKAKNGTFFLIRFVNLLASHYGQEEGPCDTPSSGERKGKSPNHSCLHEWGCRAVTSFSWEES